jgi:hypothetical protein
MMRDDSQTVGGAIEYLRRGGYLDAAAAATRDVAPPQPPRDLITLTITNRFPYKISRVVCAILSGR